MLMKVDCTGQWLGWKVLDPLGGALLSLYSALRNLSLRSRFRMLTHSLRLTQS